jgi:uncharacterized membrane protein
MENPNEYASYPRATVRPRIRFEAISEAFQFFKQEMAVWIAATLVYLLIAGGLIALIYFPMVGMMAVMQTADSTDPGAIATLLGFYAYSFFASIAVNCVMYALMGGLFRIALNQLQGKPIAIGQLFDIRGRIVSHIVAAFLVAILTTIGMMFCYLPGFIVAGLMMLVQPLIAHQSVGPIVAIKQSYESLKSEIWTALAFYLLITIVAGAGVLVCGIGLLVSYPIMILATSIVYRDFMMVPSTTYATENPNLAFTTE